jgi:hypothetical protein
MLDFNTMGGIPGMGGAGGYSTPAQGDQFGQIMLAFLSQAGVLDQGSGLVDKAKFTKYYNDTVQLQNQLDASTWSNLKSMADAWAR